MATVTDFTSTIRRGSLVLFLSTGKKATEKKSVFFNIVPSLSIVNQNKQITTPTVEGEIPEVMTPRPKKVTMDCWLSFNPGEQVTSYITNVVLSSGIYSVDFDPIERKRTLETWSESREALTLYGLTNKIEPLVITSLSETLSGSVDTVNNIHLKIGFNEAVKDTNKDVGIKITSTDSRLKF